MISASDAHRQKVETFIIEAVFKFIPALSEPYSGYNLHRLQDYHQADIYRQTTNHTYSHTQFLSP